MLYIIPTGDIFTIPNAKSYAHGCNCSGAMGKGIALQFKARFPEMYYQYKILCRERQFVPGDVFDYDYGNGHVYNLATQISWRTKAKLEYIQASVKKMIDLALLDNVNKISMPAIGCGLGGLVWNEVHNLIESISKEHPQIDLYLVKEYVSPI